MNTRLLTSKICISGFMLAAVMGGLCSSSAAHADDVHRLEHRIDSDRVQLRRDEDRMHRLEFRLDDCTRQHDWRAARDTRRDMDRVRDDIERDKRELQRDLERLHHDRDYAHDRDNYHRHE